MLKNVTCWFEKQIIFSNTATENSKYKVNSWLNVIGKEVSTFEDSLEMQSPKRVESVFRLEIHNTEGTRVYI